MAPFDKARNFTDPTWSAILCGMEQRVFVIRPAQANDGAAVAAVYGPYVRDTAVSFEVEPPTGAVMAERIIGTLGTHPWLVAEREGAVVGFAYAAKHSQRAGIPLDGGRDGVCSRHRAP